jgi:hypothetical protein
MAFASQFELIATLVEKDRYVVEIDEHGVGDLLKQILRSCHDYSGSKWDAEDLANAVSSIILGWVGTDDLVMFTENEGNGPTDWEAVDYAAKVAREVEKASPETAQPTFDIEGAQ